MLWVSCWGCAIGRPSSESFMNSSGAQNADGVMKTLPVILMALMMGIATFAIVSVFVGPANGASAANGGAAVQTKSGTPVDTNILLAAMGGLAVVATLVYLTMGKIAVSMARSAAGKASGEDDRRNAVAGALMTTSIVRAAVCEGVALLGCVIVLLTGNLLGFAGAAFGLVMIASLLPVRSRFERLQRESAWSGPGGF